MDICLWDKCNNRCVMCTNPDAPWPAWDGTSDYSFAALKSRVLRDRSRFEAGDSIYLTGGEPTIHPDFFAFVEFLVGEFPDKRIKLLSNGRLFSYPSAAERFFALGPNLEADISLYGPDAATHDRITRAAGSFDQSVRGLDALLRHRAPGQAVGLRHVISAISLDGLPAMIRYGGGRFAALDRFILMFMEIEAQAAKNFSVLAVRYDQVRALLPDIAPSFLDLPRSRLYHFPLCTVPAALWPRVWNTWPRSEVAYPDRCRDCAMRAACVGVHKEYAARFGTAEFAPFVRPIPVEYRADPCNPIAAVSADSDSL